MWTQAHQFSALSQIRKLEMDISMWEHSRGFLLLTSNNWWRRKTPKPSVVFSYCQYFTLLLSSKEIFWRASRSLIRKYFTLWSSPGCLLSFQVLPRRWVQHDAQNVGDLKPRLWLRQTHHVRGSNSSGEDACQESFQQNAYGQAQIKTMISICTRQQREAWTKDNYHHMQARHTHTPQSCNLVCMTTRKSHTFLTTQDFPYHWPTFRTGLSVPLTKMICRMCVLADPCGVRKHLLFAWDWWEKSTDWLSYSLWKIWQRWSAL